MGKPSEMRDDLGFSFPQTSDNLLTQKFQVQKAYVNNTGYGQQFGAFFLTHTPSALVHGVTKTITATTLQCDISATFQPSHYDCFENVNNQLINTVELSND